MTIKFWQDGDFENFARKLQKISCKEKPILGDFMKFTTLCQQLHCMLKGKRQFFEKNRTLGAYMQVVSGTKEKFLTATHINSFQNLSKNVHDYHPFEAASILQTAFLGESFEIFGFYRAFLHLSVLYHLCFCSLLA